MHGFNGTTSTFDNSGQSIDRQRHACTLIAPILLQGAIGILHASRINGKELGTFASTMTEFDLTGTFHGIATHTLEIVPNPMMTSSGPTTVARFGSGFKVSSFFDVLRISHSMEVRSCQPHHRGHSP